MTFSFLRRMGAYCLKYGVCAQLILPNHIRGVQNFAYFFKWCLKHGVMLEFGTVKPSKWIGRLFESIFCNMCGNMCDGRYNTLIKNRLNQVNQSNTDFIKLRKELTVLFQSVMQLVIATLEYYEIDVIQQVQLGVEPYLWSKSLIVQIVANNSDEFRLCVANCLLPMFDINAKNWLLTYFV